MKKLINLILFSFVSLISFSQNNNSLTTIDKEFEKSTASLYTYHGIVYEDSTFTPLIGVSVIPIGTTQGTLTDGDGKFSITTHSYYLLEFRLIGYKPQKIQLNTSLTTFNVYLEPDK
jgi:hypothetical protein